MFPYLTLHDATQTRNKNLLISHCYLTLELGTRLSLVTITRTSHRNTKLSWERAFFQPQMCGESLFICWQGPSSWAADITPMYPGAWWPLSQCIVVTWLPGPALLTRDTRPRHWPQGSALPSHHLLSIVSIHTTLPTFTGSEMLEYCCLLLWHCWWMLELTMTVCWGCCEQAEQF